MQKLSFDSLVLGVAFAVIALASANLIPAVSVPWWIVVMPFAALLAVALFVLALAGALYLTRQAAQRIDSIFAGLVRRFHGLGGEKRAAVADWASVPPRS